jgi:hypothetical protein
MLIGCAQTHQSTLFATAQLMFLGRPSTSSDIIRIISTGSKPGGPERPLIHENLNFWGMPTGYPGKSD